MLKYREPRGLQEGVLVFCRRKSTEPYPRHFFRMSRNILLLSSSVGRTLVSKTKGIGSNPILRNKRKSRALQCSRCLNPLKNMGCKFPQGSYTWCTFDQTRTEEVPAVNGGGANPRNCKGRTKSRYTGHV